MGKLFGLGALTRSGLLFLPAAAKANAKQPGGSKAKAAAVAVTEDGAEDVPLSHCCWCIKEVGRCGRCECGEGQPASGRMCVINAAT